MIATLAISACGSAAEPASSLPSPSTVAPALTPATATDVAPADGVIQLEYGCEAGVARCEDMPAGTYETSGQWAFLPGLRLTLPQGWSAGEQDAGEFELTQASDANRVSEIYFWSDLVPWVDGRARSDLMTVDAFADFLLADPRLVVSEALTRTFRVRGPGDSTPASVVEARSFTLLVSDSAQTEADVAHDCPAEACIGILTDTDHWDGPFELLGEFPTDDPACPGGCSQAVRLYIASMGEASDPHTFVVALSTFGVDALQSLADWEKQVEPIIASVLVPHTVVNN